MIFYFSGTGNSKWIAEQIAQYTQDTLVDILEIQEIPNINNETHIGFVFPIYAWGVSDPMMAFVGQLPKTEAFTYAICTCGEDAGLALKTISKIYPLKSCYSVVMPSNYIIGADIESEDVIRRKIEDSALECQKMAREILEKKAVYRVNEGRFAFIKTQVVSQAFNKFGRSTKAFYTTDQCNGCGLCEKNCPLSTIQLLDQKPHWGETCYQCLRCINECPQGAIQYGSGTLKRGRYTFPQNV